MVCDNNVSISISVGRHIYKHLPFHFFPKVNIDRSDCGILPNQFPQLDGKAVSTVMSPQGDLSEKVVPQTPARLWSWLSIVPYAIATLIVRFMGTAWVHLGPTAPRWVPCWPHDPCYLGIKPLSVQNEHGGRRYIFKHIFLKKYLYTDSKLTEIYWKQPNWHNSPPV